MSASDSANASEQVWDAGRYEAALGHLERLQEQIDTLRSTLPSIVAPLTRKNMSKQEVFAELKQSATASMTDVQTFRDDWKSEQTQTILNKARENLQTDTDLSKADEVPRYGWNEQQ